MNIPSAKRVQLRRPGTRTMRLRVPFAILDLLYSMRLTLRTMRCDLARLEMSAARRQRMIEIVRRIAPLAVRVPDWRDPRFAVWWREANAAVDLSDRPLDPVLAN